jgi:hypothetical protein
MGIRYLWPRSLGWHDKRREPWAGQTRTVAVESMSVTRYGEDLMNGAHRSVGGRGREGALVASAVAARPRSWVASERAAQELGRPGLERAVRRKKKRGSCGGERREGHAEGKEQAVAGLPAATARIAKRYFPFSKSFQLCFQIQI